MQFEVEQILRYLPRDGEESTHVATLSGHTAIVTAIGEDGEAGTLLHPRFKETAIAIGCTPFIVTNNAPQGIAPPPMTRRPRKAQGEDESAAA